MRQVSLDTRRVIATALLTDSLGALPEPVRADLEQIVKSGIHEVPLKALELAEQFGVPYQRILELWRARLLRDWNPTGRARMFLPSEVRDALAASTKEFLEDSNA